MDLSTSNNLNDLKDSSSSNTVCCEMSTANENIPLKCDEHEDDLQLNFEKKEKELPELQVQYDNVLDERFIDKKEEEQTEKRVENSEEISLEEEKKEEYDNLEQVLEKEVIPVQENQETESSQKNVMVQFDPILLEHLEFKLQNEAKEEGKKRKLDDPEPDLQNEKKLKVADADEVFNEVFRKVTEDLTNSLKDKKKVSLLNTVGTIEEKAKVEEDSITIKKDEKINNDFMKEKSPLRYDSFDNKDKTQNIPNNGTPQQTETPPDVDIANTTTKNISYMEPFLFTENDPRLQEGFDFIERMMLTEDDFTEISCLKEIQSEIMEQSEENCPIQ